MTYKAPITLDCCYNIVIFGCSLKVGSSVGSGVWVRYKYASNINIIGCGPRNILAGIRRMAGARGDHGMNILQGAWAGPPDWPANPEPAMLVMRAASGSSAHQHYCMSVDSNGAWVSKEWIPELET